MEASSTIKLGNDRAKEKGMIINETILSMNIGPDSTVLGHGVLQEAAKRLDTKRVKMWGSHARDHPRPPSFQQLHLTFISSTRLCGPMTAAAMRHKPSEPPTVFRKHATISLVARCQCGGEH